jgi:hypothetical protein
MVTQLGGYPTGIELLGELKGQANVRSVRTLFTAQASVISMSGELMLAVVGAGVGVCVACRVGIGGSTDSRGGCQEADMEADVEVDVEVEVAGGGGLTRAEVDRVVPRAKCLGRNQLAVQATYISKYLHRDYRNSLFWSPHLLDLQLVRQTRN